MIFFHARSGKTDEIRKILLNWRKKNSHLEIHLIRGNHDLNSGDPWPELQISSHPDPSNMLDIECRHLPVENSKKPYLQDTSIRAFPLQVLGKTLFDLPAFGLVKSL